MAKQRLHLTIDAAVKERAVRWSKENHTSISRLVGEFLERLPLQEDRWLKELPPITRSLLGIGKGDADEKDYYEYLWQKYGMPQESPPQ